MFTKALSKFDHKTVLVIGMAREGLSSAEFLLKQVESINIKATDIRDMASLDPKWSQLQNQFPNLEIVTTDQANKLSYELIIKTPGIPPHVLEKNYRLQPDVPITSNTQIFFDLITALPQLPTTIGVTGTKGKSTTTSQIFHILKQAGLPVLLGGNIGLPPLRLLENNAAPEKSIYVLELSCHQLFELTTSPNMAVIQDISPDHLDYYPDFETYFQAKTAICKYQRASDVVIFNQDSETASRMAQLSPGEKVAFSLRDHELIDFIKSSHSPLLGEHNLYNTLPGVIIAQRLDVNNETIATALASFKPVPHRLELVKTVADVKYYNDSAASAPEAAMAAIKSFAKAPIILITGGSDKGVSFAGLAQVILEENVKNLILFPTTGQKILEAIKAIGPNHQLVKTAQFASSMNEAVQLAHQMGQAGDTVLLSPGSASFNMFKNYEDRGEQFRQNVNALA